MLDFVNMPINPESPRLFTVISTFAGCGGSSLGYKWAGGKVLAAIEWDENAVQTYRLNHIGTPVLHQDIMTVTTEELLDLTGLQPGELDILDGSPPCQGFSTAGKRQIDDPRNSLFKEYVRLLRGLQPKVFVMENVSGMVKGHMKHVFAIVMRELKASGYTVKCQLMNVMYFGVPQSRERVIFIGVRNDLGIEPSYPQAQAKSITLQSALEDVQNTTLDLAESTYPRTSLSHKLLHQMKQWEGGHEYHSRGAMFGLRRLAWNRPSRTVLREDGGGASCQCCHPQENRRLTIPEIKRVASYPDNFQLLGKVGERWARIGNSVPPMFMYHLAKHIYERILRSQPCANSPASVPRSHAAVSHAGAIAHAEHEA
jgi:DNA (cytosine-5)-methyltransferase 1